MIQNSKSMNNNNYNNSQLTIKPTCGGDRPGQARSGSSCAACKLLKRRCTAACIFAPHFRGDELKKFAKVHKVFGASNVSKILVDVAEEQREDTVNSLVYEAEARLHDPVYGCIGAIALLQRQMTELQHDLAVARARLAAAASSSAVNMPAVAGWGEEGGVDVGFHDQIPVYGGDVRGCDGQLDLIGRSTLCEFVHEQLPFPLN